MIIVFYLPKVTLDKENFVGREMFEYRQLALWSGLASGSNFICVLMKLWSRSFIDWVQNSLLTGCPG